MNKNGKHKWSGPDTVAIILALGVASTVILLILVELIPHHGHISDREADTLSVALGAAVGALATYLGQSKSKHKDEDEDDNNDDI